MNTAPTGSRTTGRLPQPSATTYPRVRTREPFRLASPATSSACIPEDGSVGEYPMSIPNDVASQPRQHDAERPSRPHREHLSRCSNHCFAAGEPCANRLLRSVGAIAQSDCCSTPRCEQRRVMASRTAPNHRVAHGRAAHRAPSRWSCRHVSATGGCRPALSVGYRRSRRSPQCPDDPAPGGES